VEKTKFNSRNYHRMQAYTAAKIIDGYTRYFQEMFSYKDTEGHYKFIAPSPDNTMLEI